MTYIQLSDLLEPFQWLESLKISTNVFPDGDETLRYWSANPILPLSRVSTFVRVDESRRATR